MQVFNCVCMFLWLAVLFLYFLWFSSSEWWTSSAVTTNVHFCKEGKKKVKTNKQGRVKTSATPTKTLAGISLLLSRIIYCSSLFIPLFPFINNNYRFKSWKHLQCIQTMYIHTHYNQGLSKGGFSWHVWIEADNGKQRQRASVIKHDSTFHYTIISRSTYCAKPLQHVSNHHHHHYHSSDIYSNKMEILRDQLKKTSIALNFSFINS